MDGLSIRRAETRDIPALSALLYQVELIHHRGRPDLFRGPAAKYSRDELAVLLADETTPIFVCTDKSDVVLGYVFCRFKQHVNDDVMTDVKSLYIDDFCVEETCRGRGVGTLLIEHAKHFARETGCYNLTLNVWAFNESAIAFYEKSGLRPQKIGMETIL